MQDQNYIPRVLIVDDSQSAVRDFAEMLDGISECVPAHNSNDALELINSAAFDLILLDHDLGHGLTGLDILQHVVKTDLDIPVIMISKHDGYQMVKDALFSGAVDFLGKTPNRRELRSAVERGLQIGLAQRANRALKRDVSKHFAVGQLWQLTGTSAAIQAVNKEIMIVAPTNIHVLLTGESGTGKELAARAIHNNSKRSSGPFVALNCAGMSAEMADSELFGHNKGAYSGAVSFRNGAFAQAHGGTLFLDEIGDLKIDIQKKLLRVLEQREFKRLGGDTLIKTDVRLICATNVDMEQAVKLGSLRNDFYQRVKATAIHIPPLRSRVEDIPDLVTELLRELSKELTRGVVSISSEAMCALQAYEWPGNARELRNHLQNAAIHCQRNHIEIEDFPSISGLQVTSRSYDEAKAVDLAKFQKRYWPALAKYCNYNKTRMAEVSGLTRQGIDKILKAHEIRLFSDDEDD